MFNILLNAIKTETIIGIIAIVIIVISLGLIIATAVRNYLLHKKSLVNVEQASTENNAEQAEQNADNIAQSFEAEAEQENVDDLVQVVELDAECNDSQNVEDQGVDNDENQIVDVEVEDEQNK